MRSLDGSSASGLRPASAFVGVAAVLLAVAGKSAWIAFEARGEQPDGWSVADVSPVEPFTLVDRSGRTLGLSIECFDVSVSPRSLWRAHTPRRIARELAEILEEDPDDVLERLLPPDAEAAGVYSVESPRLLAFDERVAGRVQRWLRSGATPDHDGPGPIPGIELVALDEETYSICFAPATLFARETRLRHLPEAADRPSRWTRRLLDDLIALLDIEAHRDHPALAELPAVSVSLRPVREALREALWEELMPCQHRVVARRVDPVRARSITELMEREAISTYQLSLTATRERRHPLRPQAEASGLAARRPDGDAFALLGNWGVVPRERSEAVARQRLIREGVPADPEVAARRLAALAHEVETVRRPWSGIERAAYELLAREDWKPLVEVGSRKYVRRSRTAPRDRHEGWRRLDPDRRLDVPDYYGTDREAIAPPVVTTTLDASLQEALHERLLGLMDEHDPALAMGIVVEVNSGDVLAADGVYGYDVSGFAPLTHAFTPGSTFKAVVMATALDAGVVQPADTFPTYARSAFFVGSRQIREAEGAPTAAYITATDGIAESVNAVLVQIGLQVPPAHMRGRLVQLGYGTPPSVELGPAGGGLLPALKKGTWSTTYTHASICFGHEILVTLWQHAGAVATIARGGNWLPLRVIERVEQGGRSYEPAPPAAHQVFSREACARTRAMLAEGARRGTGEPVAGPDHCPEFEYIGTKTGTTEREATEFCLHVEWPHAVEHARIAALDSDHPDAKCSKACKEPLRHQAVHRPGRSSCYTSSMLAIGRLPGDEREVMVMVVVEDSRSKARYGRDVAGQAAIDMLRRAFDLDPLLADEEHEPGTEGAPIPSTGFPLAAALNDRDLPWLEGREEQALQEQGVLDVR